MQAFERLLRLLHATAVVADEFLALRVLTDPNLVETVEDIAGVKLDDAKSYEEITQRSVEAFKRWRKIPGPKRGEVVRRIGNAYRDVLEDLGSLVALEMGKIKAEGVRINF